MSIPILIAADNPGPYTGAGNNTWLLDGLEPTLIDAGTGVPSHVSAVAAELGGRPLRRVIVTHGHPDHVTGVPALVQRWPQLEAMKWQPHGHTRWSQLSEDRLVRAGDRLLRVIHTPGHAPDHVCLWSADRRELYGGDMVVRPGSVVIPAGAGGNLRQYLDSLRRLAALNPARIYPGHGLVIDNPLDVITEYLEHRQAREDQILACLADGITGVDAIVSRLYPGLRAGLEPAARMTVTAHLDKLREESLFP